MHPQLLAAFNSIDVKNYVVEYPITETYVSYRYAPDPFGASKREARYNPSGVDCFYIADSIETAQHEVRFLFVSGVGQNQPRRVDSKPATLSG